MAFILSCITFVVFLFCLYKISKEDHIFIRKGITPEHVFNYAFIAGIFGLFIARLMFVITNFSPQFLNPLVFLAFPRFPGLSLAGGVLGGFLGLLLVSLSRSRKLPLGRMADFFSLALLCALPVGFLGNVFTTPRNEIFLAVLLPVVFTTFAVFFMKFLYPMLIRGALKESAITETFLICFCIIFLFTDIAKSQGAILSRLNVENIGVSIILFVTLLLFIYREVLGKQARAKRK